MSSAIEVLKNMQLEQIELDKRDELRDAFYRERLDALGEALLALEQRERLKEWLEKEIKGKEMLKVHLQYQAKESIEIEINQLKEVLERVGEQK